MARDAVAEVDAPRERGRVAVRVVLQAGDEAADAPDDEAHENRHDEPITRGLCEARIFLPDLHADEPAQQPADDRLPLQDEPRRLREQGPLIDAIKPVHELVTDGGADDAAEQHRELPRFAECRERGAARAHVQAYADEDRQPLECRVDEGQLLDRHDLRRARRTTVRTRRKNSTARMRPGIENMRTAPQSLLSLMPNASPQRLQNPNPTMPRMPTIIPSTRAAFQPPSAPPGFDSFM